MTLWLVSRKKTRLAGRVDPVVPVVSLVVLPAVVLVDVVEVEVVEVEVVDVEVVEVDVVDVAEVPPPPPPPPPQPSMAAKMATMPIVTIWGRLSRRVFKNWLCIPVLIWDAQRPFEVLNRHYHPSFWVMGRYRSGWRQAKTSISYSPGILTILF